MSTPPSTPAGPETTGETRRPLVLIVEDEEPIAETLVYIIAETLVYIVEDAGYRAMVAPHGKAGLALALQHRPALIFSDLMMPHVSGPELIRALHVTLDGNAPPVVLMTAAHVRFAQDAGADVVLMKPFDVADIEALLWRFLEAH
ncbi:MAG TPA: response regulator [Ktedonobacterales bacterium]|nr:response regulator [Ktedonobacterales bacterium]